MSMLKLGVKELKVIISKDSYRYGLLNSVCKNSEMVDVAIRKYWLSFLCAGFIMRNMSDLET